MTTIQTLIILSIIFMCAANCGPSMGEFIGAIEKHKFTLQRVPINFAVLSIETQSKYADPIAIKYSKNDCFASAQLEELRSISDMDEINVTAIANLAYMALYSNYKKEYQHIYDEVIPRYLILHMDLVELYMNSTKSLSD